MHISIREVLQYIIQSAIVIGISAGVGSLNKLKDSVDVLNKQVAIIIEKTAWYEKALSEHNKRITELERKP